MADPLREVIARSRAGAAAAIPSVCSAHPEVLAASLMLAQRLDRAVVVEATSNQVNQDGGYTGMRPAEFIAFVRDIAAQTGTDPDRIVFGGDHLGPQAWRALPAAAAMAKAEAMVAAYAAAGFTKLHLDCSEGCAGEPDRPEESVTVPRAARLAAVAAAGAADPARLLFVVGTEVPPPGGARADDQGEIPPTTPAAARATLDAHAAALAGLGEIGALVAQPGVEFTPMTVHHLPPGRDPGLRAAIAHRPGVVLEAHSTDYQRPWVYPRLAALGFAFQKVGPALSFAWRQAAYALDLARGLAGWGESLLVAPMERLMTAEPRHWQGHYRGDPADLRLMRHVGFADRIRYYWPHPAAQAAVAALRADLARRRLPEPLLLQVFPQAVLDRAEGLGPDRFAALTRAAVQEALAPYFFPTPPQETA